MSRSTKIYTLTLAPGVAQVLLVNGSFYKVLSATGPISVTRDDGSTVSPLLPGRGERDVEFARLTVVDLSGGVNVVQIIVGDSSFTDDRVSGEVSVVDGETATTLALRGFIRGVRVPAVAAQNGFFSIANLAASAENVFVQDISMGGGAAGQGIQLFRFNGTHALGTLITGQNKYFGRPDSSVVVRYGSIVGIGGLGLANGNIDELPVAALTVVQRKLTQPALIEPDKGLVLMGATVNLEFYASMQWREIPV